MLAGAGRLPAPLACQSYSRFLRPTAAASTFSIEIIPETDYRVIIMYMINETTEKKEMTRTPPFGPAFTQEQADRAASMEVWGTTANDAGPDYVEFKLNDINGLFATAKIPGY